MKKRLRKKKHLKEFREYGTEVTIVYIEDAKFPFDDDNFFYRFLDEAIEGNNLDCGGGRRHGCLDMFVELGYREPLDKLKAVTGWIDQQPEVFAYTIGKVHDVWYGPFPGDK